MGPYGLIYPSIREMLVEAPPRGRSKVSEKQKFTRTKGTNTVRIPKEKIRVLA